jgi:hypothetical protein
MSMSLLPGLLGLTAGRSFSLYPPILGIAHNEWRFRRASWSEFVVVNTHSGEEACIPRSFVGDVSANAPTIIVGLRREMEWRDGIAVPYRRPVVELPIAVNDFAPTPAREPRPAHPAPVISIRLESRPPVKTGRKAVVVVMLGVVASAVVADVVRPVFLTDSLRDRINSMRVSRSWQKLKPDDDYSAVTAKLGSPAAERTYVETGGRVFRSLDYPKRHFTAILEGQTAAEARYVGSIDAQGKILGGPQVSDVGMLRSIPRF